MIAPLDIFRNELNGPLWLCTVKDFETAKAKVKELYAEKAGSYFVYSQTTQHRHDFMPEDLR
jgi:hypothetical protein